MSQGVPFTVKQGGAPNVAVVEMEIECVTGWSRDFLLATDQHYDNPDCDQDMVIRHLKEAKRRNAGAIFNGDFYCLMQGKYDKRSDKTKLRPEHQKSEYFDAVIDTTVPDLVPFAENIVQWGCGNHERSVQARHETDMTQRTLDRIYDQSGHRILRGGYSGWVVFRFRRGKQVITKKLWRIHGYAGGGPVTKDIIQLARQLAYMQEVDVMFSGHTHDLWYMPVAAIGIDQRYQPYRKLIHAVKGSCYKDEYKNGFGGWHVETGKPPKPLGAWWLRWYWEARTQTVKPQIILAD